MGQAHTFLVRRPRGRSKAKRLDAAPRTPYTPGGKNGRILKVSTDRATRALSPQTHRKLTASYPCSPPHAGRMHTGQTPEAAHLPPFLAPARDGVLALRLIFPPCSGSHFSITFFLSWKQDRSGEGVGSRARRSLPRSSERSTDP